jgi:carbon monoxide dehydrogenase subunit G
MKIERTFDLNRSRDFVWEKLADVSFVAECLPGASIVGVLGDDRYRGRMSVKVGPMAAAFDGEIAIERHPQDWTGVVSGKGADAKSSSRATGSMTYRLSEGSGPGTTRVEIVSDVNLAGPLAQFSKGAIIQEIANRITSAFAENFEARLAAADPAATAIGAAAPVPAAQSLDAGNLLWAILRDRIRAFFRRRSGGPSA